MKCFFCARSPMTGDTVFRINAKGQPGIWACREHTAQTDVAIDPKVKAIAVIIDPPRKNTP